MTDGQAVWAGRFSQAVNSFLNTWGASIDQDRFLVEADIRASRAYALALEKAGILNYSERIKILDGLYRVSFRIAEGEDLSPYEDIHSAVELLLTDEIGSTGKKLHTGRSRNEQVVTVERLWLMKQIERADEKLIAVQRVIIDLAEKYFDVIMPGYTHLQQGQPVLFSFYIMALFWQMQRGRDRLNDALKRVDVMPLGSGAMAGSTVDLDRTYMARELGFSAVSKNAMDTVSDRSFILEVLSDFSIIMLDLSRFAEDSIIFSSKEFSYVELTDAVATSSSLMPQKRNPDFYELLRAAPARMFGEFSQLFLTMKGLPLTYNKDLQEDKKPLQAICYALNVFDAVEVLLKNYRLCPKIIAQKLDTSMLATDVADWLVEQGLPFRDAHGVAGSVVQAAEKGGCSLADLSIDELCVFSPLFGDGFVLPDFENSVRRKKTTGSTHPDKVRDMIDEARGIINGETGD
ncbi:argininosuccinate lyase [bacterium]|nr:argininosuccinate lyase [bacterium]